MNSKGHLIISLIKSTIRIIGAMAAFIENSVIPIAAGLIIAEIGGIAEELIDKR